ncbi:MAG: tetratricopeptide repeat protein [Candidatus Omnitrophica bacterium]|nr:tetratricopeptide repeat protein [Candidatus Omnitrophota bacterium]
MTERKSPHQFYLHHQDLYLMAVLAVVVFVVYSPLLHAVYMLNFDDNVHFFYNSMVLNTDWRKAPLAIFFEPDNVNATYIPLTMLTFFYENVFFGLHPLVSHLINLALHFMVCCSAFQFGKMLGLSRLAAFIAVLLFAVHPMHVEPVAWVTARKDLLFSFFYLASMISYLRYVDTAKGRDYIFALLTAGLSILSKPMALSLPLVLFLLDWFRGRRFSWGMILEKMPFFLLIEPLALITYVLNARAVYFTPGHSIFLWLWCATFYIKKFFLPIDLSVIYGPSFPIKLSNPEYFFPVVFWLFIPVIMFFCRKSRLAVFAVIFYVLSLFFIWRFDFYDLTFVADRFMYLPSLGFCFILAKMVEWCWSRGRPSLILALLTVFVPLLMLSAWLRTGVWKNSYTLWTSTIKTAPEPFVLNAYGESLLEANCFKDNREDFIRDLAGSLGTSAVKFKKVFSASLDSKVNAARYALALRVFYYSQHIDPGNTEAIDNIGVMYLMFKRYDRAIPFFTKAIERASVPNGMYFYHRALANEFLGQLGLALKDYRRAVFSGSEVNAPARLNAANILFKQGVLNEALEEALLGIKSAPGDVRAYGLAISIARSMGDNVLAGKLAEALAYYRKHPFKGAPRKTLQRYY